MVQIDNMTGSIEYILDIYIPEELPLGCDANGGGVKEWWKARAIPESRKGIRQVLNSLNEKTSQSLMLSAYGLSLTDHYWLQPVDREYYWKDLNFYENDFSDELGKLLTDSGELDLDFPVSKFSPSSSVNGEMRKNYIPYRIDKAVIEGKNYPCSLSPLFTSQELEFVPAPIQTGILIILAFYMMKSSTDLCLWRRYLIQGTPCFIMKRRYRQKRIF